MSESLQGRLQMPTCGLLTVTTYCRQGKQMCFKQVLNVDGVGAVWMFACVLIDS